MRTEVVGEEPLLLLGRLGQALEALLLELDGAQTRGLGVELQAVLIHAVLVRHATQSLVAVSLTTPDQTRTAQQIHQISHTFDDKGAPGSPGWAVRCVAAARC